MAFLVKFIGRLVTERDLTKILHPLSLTNFSKTLPNIFKFASLIGASSSVFNITSLLAKHHLFQDHTNLLAGILSSIPLLFCNEREQLFIKMVVYTRVIEVILNEVAVKLDIGVPRDNIYSTIGFVLACSGLALNLYFEQVNLPS